MSSILNPVILVIDPDALTSTAVAAVLHSQNYEVISVGNPGAAIEAASGYTLDLIICDTVLPEIDGQTLIQQIRKLPNRHDVPVIFASEDQVAGIQLRKFEEGNAYYLRKPFDASSLIEMVENSLVMPHLLRSHMNQSLKRPHIAMPNSLRQGIGTNANAELE